MSGWQQKRFWTDVDVVEDAGGFGLRLDGRVVKTPAKTPLIVPSRDMAEEVRQEWLAQEEVVDPRTMPFTKSANAAIDKVSIQHTEVADLLADYGDSDLLCYRAETPTALADRQQDVWDPVLDWAATNLGARLNVHAGVMHQSQPAEAVDALRRRVHQFSAFQLAAFHDLVGLSGSLILGFAVTEGWRPAEEIWDVSRLDELWQEEQWGQDEEAEARNAHRRDEFLHADRFFRLAS